MSIYNLLEYKIDDVDVNDSASDGKSFKYKTKVVGETSQRPPQPGNPGDAEQHAQPPVLSLNIEVTIPLKYLSNFCEIF